MIPVLAVLALSLSAKPSMEAFEEAAWQEDARAEQQHQKDLKTDIEIGARYAAQVEKACKLCTDPEMIKRVQRIGAQMAELANQYHTVALWGDKRMNTFNYTFKVIQDEEPNAFSLPGGYIYIQTGLLKIIESDDELAGVLAHEISHAKFRHVAQLQRDASKLQWIQLGTILAAILTGSPNAGAAIEGGALVNTALQNGWTVQAEEAADWGGIQLMAKSKYNATGMLTCMEHLGLLEINQPGLYANQGIFRTHPPSKERADSMIKYMKENGIPIERSKVSTSFRATVKPDDKISGAVVVTFSGRNLFTFAGSDALTRADHVCEKLNVFLDSTPEMFEVTAGADGSILGGTERLLQFAQDDAAAQNKSIADLQRETIANIKSALYTVTFRIWSTH